jgi:hypothetical protein
MQNKDNSGILFVNDRKEKDGQPDFTGKAEINGEFFYVSGWKKKGKEGTFLTLAFTSKQEARSFGKSGRSTKKDDIFG